MVSAGTVPSRCVCTHTGVKALSVQRGFRLCPPKGQVLHWLLCQQVSRDPDVFRDAFGARQGPHNLCPAQNTFMLGRSRRLLCCGGEQSLLEVLSNSPRMFLWFWQIYMPPAQLHCTQLHISMLAHNKMNNIFMFSLSYLVLWNPLGFWKRPWTSWRSGVRKQLNYALTTDFHNCKTLRCRSKGGKERHQTCQCQKEGRKALQTKTRGDQHCLCQCISYQ